MKEIKSIQNNAENKQPSNLEAEQALLGSIMVNNGKQWLIMVNNGLQQWLIMVNNC